ncbi:MAG: hypothetical protein L0J44_10395, partial [Tetragenococcus koreensis]|nr:hypothetical protein [Tetragenococcus koreensis]
MTGKTTVITKEILENFDFKNYKSPSDFIEKSWNYYKDSFDSNNSINGTIFENLVAYVLAYEGIDNIYEQAEVAFVPNAIFDILLYSSEQVFTLSLKTTLRERWKQADLEAYAVKNVLKSSKSYVITLSQREVEARRKQAKNKKDFYNGLDGFVIATNTEFDD